MAANAADQLGGHVARLAPGTELNATLVARHDWTGSLATFSVRPDDRVGLFEAGQYFALGLVIDGRLLQRPYSAATGPGPIGNLEFLVRRVEQGMFSPRLWTLAPGARLRIGRAKGLFTLRPNDPRSHLFIATGSGLAPLVAMLEQLLAREATADSEPSGRPRAVLVHGVAHLDELAYRGRLEALVAGPARVAYVPIVSRAVAHGGAAWAGRAGRVPDHLDELCRANGLVPGSCVAYLCGNPAMITTVEQQLTARGFGREAIISEQYWPADAGPG